MQEQGATGAAKGMGGSKVDPAALIRVYVKHDRLQDAALLSMRYLNAWQTQA